MSKPKPRRLWLWAAALLLMVMIAAAGFWIVQPGKEKSEAPMLPVPFTAYRGWVDTPSISPDGKQVAFDWKGEKQDNFDIYIKQIGSETPRRLTTDPHYDFGPAWSHGMWVRLSLKKGARGLSPRFPLKKGKV